MHAVSVNKETDHDAWKFMMYVDDGSMMDVDTSCMKSMDLYMMYPIHHGSIVEIHRVIKYIGSGCTPLILDHINGKSLPKVSTFFGIGEVGQLFFIQVTFL